MRLAAVNGEREIRMLAETAAALKRVMRGDRPGWLEQDVLREAWAMCQARGVQPPGYPEAREFEQEGE